MLKPNKRPVVAVFLTGGTIVSRYEAATNTIAPALSGQELLSAVGDPGFCEVELIEFCNMPGPHITPQTGIMLAKEVQRTLEREEICGAVVVQGTDTLEELAYLFHLTVNNEKPVVFTGAMKSFSEPYKDSSGNLLGAMRLAASKEAYGRGVMVFFNQTILSARYVIKSHANSLDTFKAIETGAMGAIYNEIVTFFHPAQPRKVYEVTSLDADVQLVKAVCGMSPLMLEACIDRGVDGIVLEGMGAGNIPPSVLPAIQRAVEQKIPVVMVTRCVSGYATGIYSYKGGGAQLKAMGVLFGGDLNGLMARIKLMVLCSVNPDLSFIAANF